MNNLDKEFTPYEEALALKELGFDELCFGWYDCYSKAFRWFREKYGLYSVIDGLENRQYYKITQLNTYSKEYNTYEEAEIECLKKLIELVKNK